MRSCSVQNFTTALNVVPDAPFLTCGRVCMPFMCADPAPPPELLPFKTAAPPLVMEAVEMMLPVVDMLSRMWSAVLCSLLLLPPPLAPPTLMGRQFNWNPCSLDSWPNCKQSCYSDAIKSWSEF